MNNDTISFKTRMEANESKNEARANQNYPRKYRKPTTIELDCRSTHSFATASAQTLPTPLNFVKVEPMAETDQVDSIGLDEKDLTSCHDNQVELPVEYTGKVARVKRTDEHDERLKVFDSDGNLQFIPVAVKIEAGDDSDSCGEFHESLTDETQSADCVPPINDQQDTTSGNDKLKKQHAKNVKRSHRCNVCQKTFKQVCHLKSHLRIHTGEKPYECNVCARTFTQASHLKIHHHTHIDDKPYKCEICPIAPSFPVQEHFCDHSGEKLFKCPMCRKAFKLQDKLKIHSRIHTAEKSYHCSACTMCFDQISGLKSHFRTQSGEKPYKCTECCKAFGSSFNLRTHLRTHTGEKPNKCSVCSKAFGQSGDLKTHLRTHTGEKPYKCNVCPKEFGDASTLRAHLRTHYIEKPYRCNLCDKTFTAKSYLNKHRQRSHTEMSDDLGTD